MKTALFNLYWQLCQYPWYLLFNIGFSGFLYLLSLVVGPRLTAIFIKSRPDRTRPGAYFFDRLLASIVYTIILGILAIIFIFQNGVLFALMGINYYYWFLFFPLHLILDSLINWIRVRRIIPVNVVLGFGLAFIFILSSFYFPNRLITRRFSIPVNLLPSPVRIVHLSDIHCERYGQREVYLVARVNALKPDLIIITGDIFNTPWYYNTRGFEASIRFLKKLHAPDGIYAVTGHHDAQGGTEKLRESLGGHVRYLDHEWLRLNDQGYKLTFFGAIQGWHKYYPDTIDTTAGNYRIFIAHSTAWIRHLRPGDFDLALFGHTHAGQIYLPVVTTMILGPYIHGWFRKNDTPFYVNAGIGMDGFLSPRVRWFTYPEIVVIDLIPEKK